MNPVSLAEVFGPGLPFALLYGVIGIALPMWAIFDALSRPAAVFYVAGTHRTAWVVVLVVSIFLGLGFFFGAYYLIGVRGKVRAHTPAPKT